MALNWENLWSISCWNVMKVPISFTVPFVCVDVAADGRFTYIFVAFKRKKIKFFKRSFDGQGLTLKLSHRPKVMDYLHSERWIRFSCLPERQEILHIKLLPANENHSHRLPMAWFLPSKSHILYLQQECQAIKIPLCSPVWLVTELQV